MVEDLNEPANELIPVSSVIKYYYILNDVEILMHVLGVKPCYL